MPVTIETAAYRFDELSDRAKDKAREWMRQSEGEHWDGTDLYDDFVAVAECLGVDIAQTRTGQRRDGTTLYGPDISYSGFWSQGDGASFTGTYAAKRGGAGKAIRAYAPQDNVLHDIADRLDALQRKYLGVLGATISRTSHHYCHEYTVDVEATVPDDENQMQVQLDDANSLEECMRGLMRWMYRQLEADYEWRTDDAQIDELLQENDYLFDEDGDVAS